MGKGVFADNGFAALDHKAAHAGYQPGGFHDLSRVDIASELSEEIAPGAKGHDNLFEGGVARSLPNSVDGAFDLPRAVAHGREGIRYREAQIVMAMNANDCLARLKFRDSLIQTANQRAEFIRNCPADGVGNINGSCPGCDNGMANLDQKIRFGP